MILDINLYSEFIEFLIFGILDLFLSFHNSCLRSFKVLLIEVVIPTLDLKDAGWTWIYLEFIIVRSARKGSHKHWDMALLAWK